MNVSMQLLLFTAANIVLNYNTTSDYQKLQKAHMHQPYTVIFADYTTISHSELFRAIVQLFSQSSVVMIFDTAKELPRGENGFIAHPKNTVLFIEYKRRDYHMKILKEHQLWHARSRVLVIAENEDHILNWLNTLWKITRAGNVVVSVIGKNLRYYTWYPYKPVECTRVETISNVSFNSLFVSSLRDNLNGCTLTVYSNNNGFEMEIVNVMSMKLNMTPPKLVLVDTLEFLDLFTPEGRPNGFLKLTYENEADIVLGMLQRRYDFAVFADYITSHVEDKLQWYVPSPKFLTSVQKFIRALSTETWTWFGIVFVSICSAAILIKVFGTNVRSTISDVTLYAIVAYFNVPVQMPKHYLFKSLFVLLYLYSMHITTMYQSGMMYMLANKVTEAPIKTVEDAAGQKYRFFIFVHMIQLVNDSSSTLWKILDRNHLVNVTMDFILDDKLGFKSATLLPPKFAGLIIQRLNLYDDEFRPKFFPLKIPHMSMPIALLTAPGHPLVPIFDKLVQQLIETGFCTLWYNNFLGLQTLPALARENNPLSLAALGGIFHIVTIVYVISCIIFAAELLCVAIKKRREDKKLNRDTSTAPNINSYGILKEPVRVY